MHGYIIQSFSQLSSQVRNNEPNTNANPTIMNLYPGFTGNRVPIHRAIGVLLA